jgi:hypothetical protein
VITGCGGVRRQSDGYIALHELALRAPLSAAAISNAEALSVCAWNEFLAEQTRNLYPQENL